MADPPWLNNQMVGFSTINQSAGSSMMDPIQAGDLVAEAEEQVPFVAGDLRSNNVETGSNRGGYDE